MQEVSFSQSVAVYDFLVLVATGNYHILFILSCAFLVFAIHHASLESYQDTPPVLPLDLCSD